MAEYICAKKAFTLFQRGMILQLQMEFYGHRISKGSPQVQGITKIYVPPKAYSKGGGATWILVMLWTLLFLK
jgi:hypothetical protein